MQLQLRLRADFTGCKANTALVVLAGRGQHPRSAAAVKRGNSFYNVSVCAEEPASCHLCHPWPSAFIFLGCAAAGEPAREI